MRSLFTRSAALATVLALPSCGGGGGGSTPVTPANPPASSDFIVTVVGQNGSMSFSPNPASAGGRSVVFRNSDSITHRVVLNDGTIDTGDIAAGTSSRSVQMPSGGTNYHCQIHPTMVGRVNAQNGNPAPPCTGQYCE